MTISHKLDDGGENDYGDDHGWSGENGVDDGDHGGEYDDGDDHDGENCDIDDHGDEKDDGDDDAQYLCSPFRLSCTGVDSLFYRLGWAAHHSPPFQRKFLN